MGRKTRTEKPDRPAPEDPRTFTSGGVPVRRSAISLSRRFFQICNAAYAEVAAEAGLTPLEGGVLAYLNKTTGEPSIDQNGLAARLGIDRASTSALVDELEGRGLVERRVNGADRRARLLRLTPRGEAESERQPARSVAAEARIFASLKPNEREQLLNLLVRVIESNSALARPGAARRKRGFRQSSSNEQSSGVLS